MKFGQLKMIISISYLVGISLNLLIEFIIRNFQENETVISFLRAISVLAILTIWWLFYFKIGWKLPLLKKILPCINLNGTWFGEYESHNKKGEVVFGEIAIRIKQDYLSISLNSSTEKYQNYSYSEKLRHNKKSDIHGIVYVYSQKENNILDTAQRNGTSELTLKSIDNEPWLAGDFWTVHGTQGKICVRRVSEKHIDTFSEAKSVSEIRS